MAIRKDTIKKQFDAALPALLEPGEQVQAQTLTQSGPTPWLMGAIGIFIMLAMGMRYYFMVVTDRRVLFMKASMWSQRPKGLAWADPRSAVALSDVDANAVLWSHLKYRKADGSEIRLNFHRLWRDELQAAVSVLSAPPPPAWSV